MSAHCAHDHGPAAGSASPRYRRVLWWALVLNAAMFVVEAFAGLEASSVSLLADAIDFFGDAANYGVSLTVLAMPMVWRSRAAQLKAACMVGFGLFVLGRALWAFWHGEAPEPATMGLVGLLALAVNVGVAWMLYAWREGDANMRSVWLCSRNDAIGNLAVMGAALAVAGTGRSWPDLLVATGMAALALWSGASVLRHARDELSSAGAPAGPDHAHHRH